MTKIDCNFIIHIPHSSLKLPNKFYDRLLLDREYIAEENIFISDYLIDKFVPDNFVNIIKFDYSRLFCDVERFKDNEKEVMFKKGMGVIYTEESNGIDFIDIDNDYCNMIVNRYYDVHHQKLVDLTDKIINRYGNAFIIDLHSFSDEFVMKLFNFSNCPDICLGYDSDFMDYDTLEFFKSHFNECGYSVIVNYPYSGTIVPVKYLNDNSKVRSIMIEINKRIYLDNNKYLNKEKYKKLKKCMDDLYVKIIERK